ncbi:MAG: S8 family serine peptidase, partial [Candidatus Aenigmarchaeota archaeon]|nr:S8 family serine peptidase [Candidatus Aenigmarchaeota archaeon]
MKKCVYLSLILSIILITPCLGEKYIITPPNQQVVISVFNEKEINCTPIYGTNSCSGNLTKEQIKELKAKGYKIYPNLKVYAFLDESVPQIQADKLWNISVNGTNLTGKGQTICIIDTGIDYNHSALGGGWGNKVIAGWRFLDGCTINNQSCNCTYNNSACYDDNGHGTHVAGIIASNNTTYRGVSPDSKLVVVKALNSNGEGTIDNVISGINYCVDHSKEYNISIISMSLGTTDYHNNSYCDAEVPPLTSAINKATAKNISVIVASGN